MIDSNLIEDIRLAVLNGYNTEIRSLLLNKDQIDLVKYVGRHGVLRASLLSQLKGISIQNASMKLNRLYISGYLSRYETNSETGGIEYFYTTNHKIK